MRHKQLKLSVVILLGLWLTGSQAQEAISTTGGEATGSGGTVSYTVGQLVYTAHTGTNGNSIAEGAQHPFEIFVETGIEEVKGINLFVSVYPNPATDFILLSVENYNLDHLRYQLFDSNGKLLKSKKAVCNKTHINMNNLIPGNYFINIIDDGSIIKSFKIVKN
ncbi:MAG: T9SS type A sorting domain-containing protein [Bacteroidales bacterium]|nr:T9SS type A sorting domain-containing protein [Bacteroidales bacterium]